MSISHANGIMAIDQGTTSSRAIVFAHDGTVLAAAQEPFTQHFPQPGWVEHDAEEIWATQLRCCRMALELSGLQAAELAAIGIANQRETVLLWDAETGDPLGNAIVWQCRRTAERCAALEAAGYAGGVAALTGLRLDPYFSASKLEWLMANRPGAHDLLRQGRLRAGTIDSFLVWRLTGGGSHVTDYSNASRTMLLDIHRLEWADAMLELFMVPRKVLPELRPSSGVAAATDPAIFGAAVPIAGIAGDQQAALFGQGALEAGGSKNTYGTGCFLLVNTGERPAPAENGLLSTVAWVLGGPDADRQIRYALEGSVFSGGAAVQWLRDGLGLLTDAAEIGPLAAQVPDSGDVYFVPALTGLGAPYWDPNARGLLIGMTQGHHPAAHRPGGRGGHLLPDGRGAGGHGPHGRRGASPRCGWTAARRATTSSCRRRPTCPASRWSGRASWRPPRSAPRRWPDWPWGTGPKPRWRRWQASTGCSSPACPRTSAATRRARWEQAVERARGWAS